MRAHPELLEEIAIVLAGQADLEAVRAFYTQLGYSGGVGSEDRTLAATLNGQIIGVVRLCPEHGQTVLRGMQIHPAQQQKGLGARLLTACLPYMREQTVYCLPYPHLAAFYGKASFEVIAVSELPAFLIERFSRCVAEGESLIAMRRRPSTKR